MSDLHVKLIVNNQRLNYVDKPKIKLGTAKKESKMRSDGTIAIHEMRDGTESYVTVAFSSNDKVMLDLMIELKRAGINRDGSGNIIMKAIYGNDVNNPLVFEGGFLEDLPEMEDQGTTEYTFKFNHYSETK